MGVRRGRDYVAALRDGRRVYHAGRRIADVTTHPGFAGAVRTLAGLYDRQHDPADADTMTVEWEGERISRSYFPPTTADELAARRRNSELWADATLGHMGRSPDFCASLTVGIVNFADRLEPRFAANAHDYHRYAATHDLCLTHALNDQFYDRAKSARGQDDPDLIMHVVRETSDGPIVRGLRNLATLAPLSDEALVYPNRTRAADEPDYAIAFAIPMNAPGLSIICRDLYAEHADPERLPLSARFDEVDATLIFDDVLVPWERVFVYRDPALAAAFHPGINPWGGFVNIVRLMRRLEMFLGVADLLATWSTSKIDESSQVQLGQLIQDVEVLRACVAQSELHAVRSPAGFLMPHVAISYRLHGIEAADRAVRVVQDLLTSSLMLTGGASDLSSAEIGPYVERFFKNQAPSTRDHLRVLAMAADMVLSAFAGRQQLYERLHSGEPDRIRMRLASAANRSALTERVLRFVRDEWDAPAPAAALVAPGDKGTD